MLETTPRSRTLYLARVHRAMDHIEANLDQELTLDEIASVALFSPFHFHRIFRAVTGETLSRFITRLRLERAANRLLDGSETPITTIAFESGFSGPDTFARAFRESYGMRPGEFRKMGQTVRKPGQAPPDPRWYPVGVTTDHQPLEEIMETTLAPEKVDVVDLPERSLAYIRHIGPYAGDETLFQDLFNRLMRWAGPRGLLRFPETEVIFVYHDSPKITDENHLRVSVAITVPDDTEGSGEIGVMRLAGGKYACARFEIEATDFGRAWDAVCGAWLPDSGYVPDDRLCFERYHNNVDEHPEHKHIVDICIPVRPL